MRSRILGVCPTALATALVALVMAPGVAPAQDFFEAQKITPPGLPNNAWFGHSITMSETTLAVGTEACPRL